MKPKNPNAQAMGALGGKARAKSLTAERRAEIARTAAEKRWANYRRDNTEPRHPAGCICADCSAAELTADND